MPDSTTQTPQLQAVPPDGSKEAPKKRNPPNKPLPTDRIAFQKQLDLLRAWVAASGAGTRPANNKDVGTIIKFSENTTSLANAFFVANGFLQRGGDGGYTPTAPVIAYNKAWSWNKETAAQKLAPLLAEAWFGQALIPRLEFGEIPESEAVQLLAETCNAAPEYESQLRTLLEYLATAAIIVRENGVIRLRRGVQPAVEEEKSMSTPNDPARPIVQAPPSPSVVSFFQQARGAVQFKVDVSVDMAEFATWSPDRISAFFSGLAEVLKAKGTIETKGTE